MPCLARRVARPAEVRKGVESPPVVCVFMTTEERDCAPAPLGLG